MNEKARLNFLLVFLVGALVLAFFIFWPFFYALALALILAVACWPLNQRLLKVFGRWPGLAALTTTALVIIFILAPLVILGGQIFKEALQFYQSLAENSGRELVLGALRSLMDRLQQLWPGAGDSSLNLDQYLKQAATWLVQNLGALFSNFATLLVDLFIFLIAFYYLLKDGAAVKKILADISPLSGEENEAILGKLERAINSVVRGNLIIALIQGILTSVGLAIFGVPNPMLWGMVAAITALIPTVGTSLVMVPSIAYLYFTGHGLPAAGLFIWGIGAVGLVDNFLGPRIVGRGMRLHPLLVILAVMGGLAFFGPIGFLLGPLALSLLCALFDIYFSLFRQT